METPSPMKFVLLYQGENLVTATDALRYAGELAAIRVAELERTISNMEADSPGSGVLFMRLQKAEARVEYLEGTIKGHQTAGQTFRRYKTALEEIKSSYPGSRVFLDSYADNARQIATEALKG